MKIGDRVMTEYGEGVIVAEEPNRIENRYGVELDYTDQVPWNTDECPDMPYPKNKTMYFFKRELKSLTHKNLVLQYYPNALCELRNYGKEYYIVWNGNSSIGQGKTEDQAWAAAYKYTYD